MTLFTTTYTYLRILLVTIICLTLVLPGAGVLAQEDTEPVGLLDDEVVVIEVDETDTAILTDSAPDVVRDSYVREPLPSREAFGDFVIGPGRFDVQLAPGQSRTVEMTVANRLGEGRFFSFDTEDMTGSTDPSQTVQLLGDAVGPYTLRDFISVPHQRFYLEHGERARIPITITLPADAEPGGRYGSLLTAVTSNPLEVSLDGGTRSGAPVVSRIGTLFFITTPGDIVRDSELVDFAARNNQKFFAAGPVTFDVVVENSGSVHTSPYGQMVITNIFGEEVGRTNLDPWYVMPESVRAREIRWDREALFGRYTATMAVNRGYDDIVDEMSYSFYVIPWKWLVMVFGGLFIFFLLLRFVFSRFEFKRKT